MEINQDMILIDTNIYVAYLNKRDQNHTRTKELIVHLLEGKYGSRFTISEVFTETATVLFKRTKRQDLVKKAWSLIYSTDNAWGQTLVVSKEYIDEAWKIFCSYTTPQRPLSFVDCLLIAVAKTLGIQKIVSFDNEFDGIIERIY